MSELEGMKKERKGRWRFEVWSWLISEKGEGRGEKKNKKPPRSGHRGHRG